MSGFLERMREDRQERLEERREAHPGRGRHNHLGGRHDDFDRYDDSGRGRGRGRGQVYDQGQGYGGQGYGQEPGYGYGSQHRGPDRDAYDDDGPRGYGGGGGGYAPPSGPPPGHNSGFGSLGGLDRGDFATDEDIDRMVSTGELGGRPGGRQGQGYERDGEGGYGGMGRGGGGGGDRYGAPPGPPGRGQGYSDYDAPAGPPPGRGYQRQEPQHQGYESGGGYGSGYGRGSDRPNQYGTQQGESHPQGPPSNYGQSHSNAPSGGFSASRDDGDQYGSGFGGSSGRPGGRGEPPRRGEADSYYGQQGPSGRGENYAHLADIAHEHGDDPEMYRQATQGLHEKIQSQSVRPDQDDDYQAHVDAHRKAYGGDDHGPMNADAIGAAAAMEAFKQTAAGANKPSGGLMGGKPSGGLSAKPGPGAGQVAEEEEEDSSTAAGGRGLQDKLMALAMSHAGKLFDKKNPGSNASGGSAGGSGGADKAQAMQAAAATAMQLFAQYQKKGKLDSSDIDMSTVMQLAKNLF